MPQTRPRRSRRLQERRLLGLGLQEQPPPQRGVVIIYYLLLVLATTPPRSEVSIFLTTFIK